MEWIDTGDKELLTKVERVIDSAIQNLTDLDLSDEDKIALV